MSNLHIVREHALGLAKARKIAFQWAEQAEAELDMQCIYEEGKSEDVVRFARSGASGTLKVAAHKFELEAKLGFLLGVFKDRIEAEIVKTLDGLLSGASAAKPAAKKAAAKKK